MNNALCKIGQTNANPKSNVILCWARRIPEYMLGNISLTMLNLRLYILMQGVTGLRYRHKKSQPQKACATLIHKRMSRLYNTVMYLLHIETVFVIVVVIAYYMAHTSEDHS